MCVRIFPMHYLTYLPKPYIVLARAAWAITPPVIRLKIGKLGKDHMAPDILVESCLFSLV
jgi:hypothetical protein